MLLRSKKILLGLFVPFILLAITACPGVIDNIQITTGPGGAIIGATITFSCISPVTQDIVTYRWFFGDGNSAEGQTVTHSYSSNGQFTVECHVLTSNSVLIFSQLVEIAPISTELYFTNALSIESCSTATCSDATVTELANLIGLGGAPFPWAITASETDLYWTSTIDDKIQTCPIATCSIGTIVDLITAGLDETDGIVATETDLYWTDRGTDKIQTCPIATCSNGTIVDLVDSGLDSPAFIAATATNLYWTDVGTDKIQSCPIATCSNGTVVDLVDSGLIDPLGITATASNLYWSNNGLERIQTCPILTCSNATVSDLALISSSNIRGITDVPGP